MAARGNVFALLGVDDDSEDLLAVALQAEVPPSVVDKRTGKNNKTGSSSLSSFQSSSAPQHTSPHEKGSDKWHGSERSNRNGFLPNNREENGSRQNNRGGIALNRKNGYMHEGRPSAGRHSNGYPKKSEIYNGHQKKEEQSGDGWQVVARSNGHKQINVNHLQPPRDGNGSGREINYVRRKELNTRDSQHVQESGKTRVTNGSVEKWTDNAGEGRFNGERRFATTAEGKKNGKSSESFQEKEVQKDNAGPQSDETASRDGDSSKGKHDKVVSKEEAERLALEAKQMTLKQYEKQLEEKRRSLDNMKTEERRVALDKEFESMQIIERKKEETNFVKLSSANDKLKKKKAANNKDNTNAHKVKYLVVHPRRPRARRDDRPDTLISVEKSSTPQLTFEDAKQFPALGLNGSIKAK